MQDISLCSSLHAAAMSAACRGEIAITHPTVQIINLHSAPRKGPKIKRDSLDIFPRLPPRPTASAACTRSYTCFSALHQSGIFIKTLHLDLPPQIWMLKVKHTITRQPGPSSEHAVLSYVKQLSWGGRCSSCLTEAGRVQTFGTKSCLFRCCPFLVNQVQLCCLQC